MADSEEVADSSDDCELIYCGVVEANLNIYGNQNKEAGHIMMPTQQYHPMLLQVHTLEEEDKFLYSTPITDLFKESSRQENPASPKEGLGSSSDNDIIILEEYLHSPKENIRNLSWKSATAWREENQLKKNTSITSHDYPSPGYHRSRARSRSPRPYYRRRLSKTRLPERSRQESPDRSPRWRHQSRAKSPRNHSKDSRLIPVSSHCGRASKRGLSKISSEVAKEDQKVLGHPKMCLTDSHALFDPYFMTKECILIRLKQNIDQIWQSNTLNELVALQYEIDEAHSKNMELIQKNTEDVPIRPKDS